MESLINQYVALTLPLAVECCIEENREQAEGFASERGVSLAELEILFQQKASKRKKSESQETALAGVEIGFGYVEPQKEGKTFTVGLELPKKAKGFELVLAKVLSEVISEAETIFSNKLSDFELAKQTTFLRTVMGVANEAQCLTSFVFFRRFGALINQMTVEKYCLGNRLRGYIETLLQVAKDKRLERQEEQKRQKAQAFAQEIQALEEINKLIYGRSEVVTNLLSALRNGNDLSLPDTKKLDSLRRKFVAENYERTEAALPFLYFIVTEVLPTLPDGQWLKEMVSSFYAQVKEGFALSDKQLNVLAKQYPRYKDLFARHDEEYRLPTDKVIENLKQGKNIESCQRVLELRGVAYQMAESDFKAVEML